MNREINEKQVFSDKIRTVRIVKYPDDCMLDAIAKKHGEIADKVIFGLTNIITHAHYSSDFFSVLLYGGNDDIIGCANFIQSSAEPSKWLYTDLWVDPEYRRRGFAREMVSAGMRHLSELKAKTLLCTVDPENRASLNLQRSLGFAQIETEPFEFFELDGLLMFKQDIPMNLNIIPLADDFNHLGFICDLLTDPSNASALHLKSISENEYRQFFREMRAALILNAPEDERNYMIRKGVVPVAWIKLNGFSEDSLWISTLVVHEKFRNLGAGMFALNYAEEFALSTGRKHIYINTTADNAAAQSLYKKAGYTVEEETVQQYEDGAELVSSTFHKEMIVH